MPIHNLHEKPFDKGTQDKLNLYRDYLREWLPVFTNSRFLDTIQIFDFFAGPGIDLNGNSGSPAIACDETRNALGLAGKPCKIKMYFNEYDSDKFHILNSCIEKEKTSLPQVEFFTLQKDFCSAFNQWHPLMNKKSANLLFLDQNGVKQITRSVFQTIVQLPRTGFLFFISSGSINRFKVQPEIRDYVPVTDNDLLNMNGTNVHRIVANAYRRWLPGGLQYFLGSFSIRKGSNVYGLIFGSGHPLGIDKFLKVAWKKGNDANFDIDKDGFDPNQPSLPGFNKSTKIEVFEKEVEQAVLDRYLNTNKDVYLFALQNGVLARHAKEALNLLVKKRKLPEQSFHISYDAWKKPIAEPIRHFKENMS